MKLLSYIMALGAVASMVSCSKNKLPVPLEFDLQAKVKINYASAYAGNPSVMMKVNGETVITGIKYAYPFPGGGLNTQGGSQPDYLNMATGNTTLSLSVPNVGKSTDSIQLYSGSVTLPGSGYYTIHVADTMANTQMLVLEENTATPDSGFSRYRFVNLIPNLPGLDLYFNNVKVADNIPYMNASASFDIAFPTASSWAIRPAGAAPGSTALATYANTSPNQRVFTVFARGYNGSTDANRKPNVSLYYVR